MKMRRFFALLLVIVLMLAGCGEDVFDDTALRADAEVLMAAFLNDDYDGCFAVVENAVSDGELRQIFPAIVEELRDLGEYEMTAVGWNRKITGDRDQKSVNYLVSGEGGKYYLSVTKVEGIEGLAGFQISAAEADAEPTRQAGPVNWIVTIIGFAVLGFVIWMVVDCVRRKMKRKWLWIPLVLLGSVVLTLALRDGGMNFRYNIGLYLGVSSLVNYQAGGFMLKLYIPLGAIVYFMKRKQLTAAEEPVQEISNGEEAEG